MSVTVRPMTREDIEDMLGYERGALSEDKVFHDVAGVMEIHPLFQWILADMSPAERTKRLPVWEFNPTKKAPER